MLLYANIFYIVNVNFSYFFFDKIITTTKTNIELSLKEKKKAKLIDKTWHLMRTLQLTYFVFSLWINETYRTKMCFLQYFFFFFCIYKKEFEILSSISNNMHILNRKHYFLRIHQKSKKNQQQQPQQHSSDWKAMCLFVTINVTNPAESLAWNLHIFSINKKENRKNKAKQNYNEITGFYD